MRIIFLTSVVFFFFSFSGQLAFAQNEPLEKKVTITAQNEPLENVLASITKQTGTRFSYNSQLINPKTKVTVNAQNKTLKEVLPKILPVTVSYKKVGEHIVFFSKQEIFTEKESHASRVTHHEKNTFLNNGKLPDDCLDSISFSKNSKNLTEDSTNLTKEEMKAQITGIMLAIATASAPIAAQDTLKTETVQGTEILQEEVKDIIPEKNLISIPEDSSLTKNLIPLVPFQITFIYPLGSGWVKSAEKCYNLSINILSGVTGQIKGVEIGSLFNINKYGAMGAQFAGLFNITGAKNSEINSRNAQFAGLFNITQKGKSAQFAGLFNIGDTAYFQGAGIFNVAKQSFFQAAGIINHGGSVHFQAAGIGNSVQETKCQLAGIYNKAQKSVCQIAGIVNVSQESHCQIAGIVNITKKGKFQMGLINVRDTADGISLGLINIVKKGGILEAGIEAGEFIHTAVTFRSGVQRLYSIISLGYNYTDHFWTLGSGLGTSVKLIGNLNVNFELTFTRFFKNYTFCSFIQFAPMLNYRFAKHFKIYVGPSLNLLTRNTNPLNPYWLPIMPYPITSPITIPYSFYNQTFNNTTLDMWVGVKGGIKF